MANQNDARREGRCSHRRGTAIIYIVVCLPAMLLMASLAVDLGRAQTAKSQLYAAVDAAARVAGQDLANYQSNSTALADAMSAAASNNVDGVPLTLQASDIVFGSWDTGARLFTANTATTNAVKITGYRCASRGNAIPTMLAAVVGNTTVNIHASCIVYISHGLACFNASSNVTFNDTGVTNGGTWATDSFLGNLSAYSPTSAGSDGDLCTNGSVNYNFVTPPSAQSGTANMINDYVTGQIYSANGADCTYTWQQNGTQGGAYWIQYGATDDPGPSTTLMNTPAVFPTPKMPTGNINPSIPTCYLSGSYSSGLQDLTVADGSVVTLPGGTYTLNSLSISSNSTVIFSGPATLNVATNVTIDTAALQGQQDVAKYLKINVCNTGAAGANSVTINNPTHGVYADINAPLANFSYTEANQGNDYYGRIYSNTMTVTSNGNGGWHADRSLSTAFHIVQ